MKEHEWVNATYPAPMLSFLQGKANDRKVRLFACACVRRVWELLLDERSRNAVAVAEWFADRLATAAELDKAYHAEGRAAAGLHAAAWPAAQPPQAAFSLARRENPR